MAGWTMRRMGALGAFVFVVLNVIGFSIAGSMPKYAASGDSIVSWFSHHHKAMTISVLLVWVAVVFLVGVMGQLAELARERGHHDTGYALTIVTGAAAGMLAAGMGMYGVITRLATDGTDSGIVHAFYDAAAFLFTGLNWITFALVIIMLRAARNGVFAAWTTWLNMLVGAGLVLGGLGVRSHGALAAGTGAFALIGFIATMVLFLEIGTLLWQASAVHRHAHSPAPHPA
jgi:hypothetical protein